MWKGVIGVEVGVDTVLVFPLARPVEVLVCVGAEEEKREEDEVVVRDEEHEEDGVCGGGVAFREGRMGREYVRRAGAALEVSFGGAGTRTWVDAAAAVFTT